MLRKLLFLFTAALICSDRADATTFNVSVGSGGNTFSPSSGVTMAIGDTIKFSLAGGSHNVTASSIPGGATAFGSPSPMGSTYIYVPNVAGTYNYVCTFHPGMSGTFTVTGCSGPSSKPVITSSNGATACAGGTALALSIPAQAGATYQWFNGAAAVTGATAASLNVATTAANAGSYTVKVSRCSVDSVSAPFTVTINALPVPAFTEAHTALSYTFTNTTPSPASHTYIWTFSDGSPAQTTTNASRTFTSAGTYTVTLRATTAATSCFATTVPLTVQAKLGIGTLAGESYSVVPNPASAVITVSVPANASLRLTDMSGRAMKVSISGTDRTRRLDVSGLPAGLYLLCISTDAAGVTETITVTH